MTIAVVLAFAAAGLLFGAGLGARVAVARRTTRDARATTRLARGLWRQAVVDWRAVGSYVGGTLIIALLVAAYLIGQS